MTSTEPMQPAPRTPGAPGTENLKRASFESLTSLTGVERDDLAAPRRRPATTTLGALFVMVRAVFGLLWLLLLVLVWDAEVAPALAIDGDVSHFTLIAIIVVLGLADLALFWLGALIWRGSNFARVIVMIGLTLSILTAASSYFTLGEKITMESTLFTLTLDILVLLALSSSDARNWSRFRGAERRERAAQSRG